MTAETFSYRRAVVRIMVFSLAYAVLFGLLMAWGGTVMDNLGCGALNSGRPADECEQMAQEGFPMSRQVFGGMAASVIVPTLISCAVIVWRRWAGSPLKIMMLPVVQFAVALIAGGVFFLATSGETGIVGNMVSMAGLFFVASFPQWVLGMIHLLAVETAHPPKKQGNRQPFRLKQ
ncbi:hypothetical protein [Neisseria sp.]|uniref:hypothetical protein n=1 Tax=Neisseria sp. TaxID=192066 RepID=UPI0035A0A7A0